MDDIIFSGTTSNVFSRKGEWFYRTEDENENGPFPTESKALSEYRRYCYFLESGIDVPEADWTEPTIQ